MKQTFLHIISVAAILAAFPCKAEEQQIESSEAKTYDLDTIVVTAHEMPTALSQTPGGIGVMQSEEFFRLSPISLSDTTVRIPGVDVSKDSPWGGEVVIRGLSRGRLVYLVDGMRINTATDVAGQFGFLMPEEIERVEVLKGPVSELYGTGSIGGVVNVITRRANFTEESEFHCGLSLNGGTNAIGFGSHAWSSWSDDRVWLYASAGYREFDAYRDGAGDRVKNSFFRDRQLALKGGFKWDSWNVSEISYLRYRAANVGVPGGSNLPAASQRVRFPRHPMEAISLKHTITPDDGAWVKSVLQLYWNELERKVLIDSFNRVASGAQQNYVSPDAKHRNVGGRLDNVFEVTERQNLTLGIDFWRWKYTGKRIKDVTHPSLGHRVVRDRPMADTTECNLGAFAEYDWKISEGLQLNLGARIDRNWTHSGRLHSVAVNGSKTLVRNGDSSRDWAGSAHVGLTWNLAEHWSMTLLGARGYRTADMMDRYKYIALNATAGTAAFGNPRLDAETSWYGEYGVHYTSASLSASVALFCNDIHDMIEEEDYGTPVTVGGVRYYNTIVRNVNHAVIVGAEGDFRWKFTDGWTLYGNVAWLEGRNRSEHTYLRNVSPLNGLCGIRCNLHESLWCEAEGIATAKQEHTPDGVAGTAGHVTFNARVGYDFTLAGMKASLVASANNILDKKYANYLSSVRNLTYCEPGRNFTLALSTWF